MTFAVPSAGPTVVPVLGTTSVFAVRRIYCVGRNYAEHAQEMGHDPEREPPFFFCKPADAVVGSGAMLSFPQSTSELHHEIELVVALSSGGAEITNGSALQHVFGYAVGLDMTRRDLQAEFKRLRRPWDLAKGFDESAPCSAIQPAAEVGHPERGEIWLKVNGSIRQQGDLAQQIWKVSETIAYLSRFVALMAGDLIMTGTPKGVGLVEPGDVLEGGIEGVGELRIKYLP